MLRKKNRYDPDRLPLSANTREGLTGASIDQLKAISIMLCLQDEVYNDMFTVIIEGQKDINIRLDNIMAKLEDHEGRIGKIEEIIKQKIAV